MANIFSSAFNLDDRRFKRLSLPMDFPLQFIAFESLQPGLCIPTKKFKTDSLPQGIKVVAVDYNMAIAAWTYILYHKDWPVLPMGEIIPEIQEEVHIEVIVIGDEPSKQVHSLGTAKSWRDLPSLLGG